MPQLRHSYEPPPTAQQVVLLALRRAILEGDLRPGDQLVQESLAADLNTSVVPVREALKVLESEGQVVYYPHRGYFIARLEVSELTEICEIRALLESAAIRRSLPVVAEDELDRMAGEIALMEAADRDGEVMAFLAADRRFHRVLLEPGGGPRLMRLIDLLWDQSDPYRAMFFSSATLRTSNHDEHRAILDAARQRDTAKVIELLDAHRLNAVEQLREVLAPAPEDGDGDRPARAEVRRSGLRRRA